MAYSERAYHNPAQGIIGEPCAHMATREEATRIARIEATGRALARRTHGRAR